MTPTRAASLVLGITAAYVVRVLARLKPQRWLSPWITLHLFRFSSRTGYALTIASMRRNLPSPPTWTTRTDLIYAPGGRDGLYDLVIPEGPGPHPWVLWVHGGGWHFGDKGYPLPYLELLASRGIAGVAVNYPLAPASRHPAAPRAVNDALTHLVAHATELNLDPDRVVLAGDSAGAQVAAQVATVTTNADYAIEVGLVPALRPDQLRGALLFCGIFDTAALNDSDRAFEAGLESAMWSLARTRRWQQSPACHQMSIVRHVTADFPSTFLAAGNADPLTRRQTPPMAARLADLGVEVHGYYPGTSEKPIHHEFQFWLATPEGIEGLERAEAFVKKVVSS